MEQNEDIKAHTLHLAEQNMDQAISILRGWLNTEGATLERAA